MHHDGIATSVIQLAEFSPVLGTFLASASELE